MYVPSLQEDIFHINNKVNKLNEKVDHNRTVSDIKSKLHHDILVDLDNKFRELKIKTNAIETLLNTPQKAPERFSGYEAAWFLMDDMKPFVVDKTGVYEARNGYLFMVTDLESQVEQPIKGYLLDNRNDRVVATWNRDGSYWPHPNTKPDNLNLVKLIKEYKFQ